MIKVCIDSDLGRSSTDDDKNSGKAAYRRLLAPYGDDCEDGQEALWSIKLIHDIHILIFLISVTHIFYSALSLILCMWSMRHWPKWEKEHIDEITAGNGTVTMMALRTGLLQRVGELNWHFKLRSFLRQFLHKMDKPTYLALRRMRLESLEVVFITIH